MSRQILDRLENLAHTKRVLSLSQLLLLTAFVITMAHSIWKAPLWPAVLLLIVLLWMR